MLSNSQRGESALYHNGTFIWSLTNKKTCACFLFCMKETSKSWCFSNIDGFQSTRRAASIPLVYLWTINAIAKLILIIFSANCPEGYAWFLKLGDCENGGAFVTLCYSYMYPYINCEGVQLCQTWKKKFYKNCRIFQELNQRNTRTIVSEFRNLEKSCFLTTEKGYFNGFLKPILDVFDYDTRIFTGLNTWQPKTETVNSQFHIVVQSPRNKFLNTGIPQNSWVYIQYVSEEV